MDDTQQQLAEGELEHIFQAKKEWHKRRAKLPLKEKIRILLEIQRTAYPHIASRRELKSWEKPWEIEP